MTWAKHLYSFYAHLEPPAALPNHIEWLYPQRDPLVMDVVKCFLDKYYNDNKPRTLLLGINPGRFGAGVTGVNFTGPRQLKENCGIPHPFPNGSELSAEFIYKMIGDYGGPELFYKKFFIGSVSPLGFVKDGKNINYYDDKVLLKIVEPFIIHNLEKLINPNMDRKKCFAIGGEKNFKYLCHLNKQKGWFQKIIPLPHPRFIMQYKRKQVDSFIQFYLDALND